MTTEIYFVTEQQAEQEMDDRIRQELFEAKCEPQGELDMVLFWECAEDERLKGKGIWKRGWYFEDDDIGFEGPFATKEATEARIEEWRSFLLGLSSSSQN
jgi:hypothetical protein